VPDGPLVPPTLYTPKRLAEKILASKSALEGERKQVTVLFADLKGSLELLVDRDPEDARQLLDAVVERMMDAVHQYEGTVNQVVGDGIMALFGAPIAHEDHAVRACYAALGMQSAIGRYAADARRSFGIEPQIRVGLNSGEVLVRAIGNDLRLDYTAIGQTTHLASRMEQLAPPGRTRLTLDTLRLAEGRVNVAPLGPVPVKGLSAPIEVFDLLGAEPTRTRLQAAARRGLTRFVGRPRELEKLGHALDEAGQGRGQVVELAGEPGVGKSRLAWEFRRSSRAQGWLTLEGDAVSFSKSTAYRPVINLLKAYFQIEPGDDARKIRERVTGRLLTLDETLKPTLPALLSLLDVPAPDSEWESLDPAGRRDRTIEACTRLLLQESRVQPLLVVLEDLHWIDSETQAFLDRLVDSVATARVLLVVTARPEYAHGWDDKPQYSRLRIEPLSPDSASELLRSLLGGDERLAPLRRLLIERTEGNPFFLEETVRALVESRVLEGQPGTHVLAKPAAAIQVPATVRAVLAARIDRLPPVDKRILESAAILGRLVAIELLQAIADVPDETLRLGILHLQGAGFLSEPVTSPERACTFTHALTHEVAYAGLTHERRRSLHAAVVLALERRAGQRTGDHAEALAQHAIGGELWEKAIDYLRQAGAKAYDRGAVGESLARFEKALEITQNLATSPDNLRRGIDVRLDFHMPLFVLGQITRLVELHREADRLARELDDEPRLGRIAYRMGVYSWMNGRYREGIAYTRQALQNVAAGVDADLRIWVTHTLGVNHIGLGQYRAAIEHFSRNVDGPDAEPARRRVGLAFASPYVLDCGWLAWAYSGIGDFERALRYAETGVREADASGHPQSQAFAGALRAVPELARGEFAAARHWLEAAVELCEQRGLVTWRPVSCGLLGRALAWSGSASEGLAWLERSVVFAESLGLASVLSLTYVFLAEGLFLAGKLVDAKQAGHRALERATLSGEQGVELDALRVLAEIAAAQGRLEPAVNLYEQAETLAGALEARPLLAICRLGLGRLARRRGDHAPARQQLLAASALFRAMRMPYWLCQAERALREVPR
jgi:class 3 adenylate cyclase/tetratricopeptide (TPR) repeat protein